MLIGLLGALNIAGFAAEDDVVIKNEFIRYTVSPGGKNLGFVDRATGFDYLRREAISVCALVRQSGKEFPASSAALADGRLTLRFGDAGVEAVLKNRTADLLDSTDRRIGEGPRRSSPWCF